MDTKLDHNPPPDWTTRAADLLCPLCEYNLRGLTESRCPECGFKFQWQELIDAEKNKQNFLFEDGQSRSAETFWKTYWRTCRPRHFWKELSPAHEVQAFRLLGYWLLCQLLSAILIGLLPKIYGSVGIPLLRSYFGPRSYRSAYRLHHPSGSEDLIWIAILAIWPWLTLASLLVFRFSMRQTKIRYIHLIRTVIYSCDFGFLAAIAFCGVSISVLSLHSGWIELLCAIACCVTTTYRLTIAFRRYLRVHLPFATVLTSQLITFQVVFLILVQIADFSRWM